MAVMTLSRSDGGYSNTELSEWVVDLPSLVKIFKQPVIGPKDGAYFIRCPGTQRNNKDVSDTAEILIIDGDSQIGEDGEIIKGAPDPADVHRVLTVLKVGHVIYATHSNGAKGDDFYKYRVIIPCTYTPEQLPALLEHLFHQLHSEGVMLAPVTENRTWSQGWYFPRVPDEQRKELFRFYALVNLSLVKPLDVKGIRAQWQKAQPILKEPPPLVRQSQPNENLPGSRNPIKEFNQSFVCVQVLERNGYIRKGNKWLRPDSESNIPAVQLCLNCKDGTERVFSHGGDALNDGFAHDAFDVYRLLECGGDLAKALNWDEEITKHNRRLHMQEQAKLKITEVVSDDNAAPFSLSSTLLN